MDLFSFFFQAEDGIRDTSVTGVQTCALPILLGGRASRPIANPAYPSEVGLPRWRGDISAGSPADLAASIPIAGRCCPAAKIGRASCRERVWRGGVGCSVERRSGRWRGQRSVV